MKGYILQRMDKAKVKVKCESSLFLIEFDSVYQQSIFSEEGFGEILMNVCKILLILLTKP